MSWCWGFTTIIILCVLNILKRREEIEQEKSIARYLDDPECLVYVALKGKRADCWAYLGGISVEFISTVSKTGSDG